MRLLKCLKNHHLHTSFNLLQEGMAVLCHHGDQYLCFLNPDTEFHSEISCIFTRCKKDLFLSNGSVIWHFNTPLCFKLFHCPIPCGTRFHDLDRSPMRVRDSCSMQILQHSYILIWPEALKKKEWVKEEHKISTQYLGMHWFLPFSLLTVPVWHLTSQPCLHCIYMVQYL